MFLRRSLSLFLVGIGIGSPWLVRDWLAARSDASRPPSLWSEWSGRIQERWRNSDESVAEETVPLETEETAERQPYPLASQTRRIVEGFFGGGGTPSGPRPSAGPPSTPRSRAIVEAALARMEPELGKQGLSGGDPVVLRLFKEEGELEVWMKPSSDPHYTLFKVHRIASSAGRPGPKLREGDGQAPEGFYEVSAEGLRPGTRHYLGLDFGYPNSLDRHLGRTGGEMMIHAGSTAAGAYALSPEGMEEVYALADAALRSGTGTVGVHLFPFRLTDKRMDQVVEERSRWSEEWVNLKEGYDFFENVRQPPVLGIEAGRYVFRMGKGEF